MGGKAILEDVRHALDAIPLAERRQLKEVFVVQVDIREEGSIMTGGRLFPEQVRILQSL